MGNLSLCFFAFMYLVSSSLPFHTAAFTHFPSSSLHPICHDQERSALLKFKDSLIIDQFASLDPSAYPKVASWEPDKENSNCCLWDGIECDEETGHVVGVDLSSSFLYCSINSTSSLFDLVHLQWLNLADNNFDLSTIPSGIINFTTLSHLNLSFSGFSGQIPREILELSKLAFLDLSYNDDLELQNPNLNDLVGNLFNLNVLDLSRVKISSPIPPALTNLSSLTFLSFRRCGLQGKILSSLADLTKLEHLDLSYNGFSGELPASFGNLTQLSYLSISGNNNSPIRTSYSLSWIANLQNLTYLALSNSSLTGEIPSALMNLTQLTKLDLSYNQLTGPIPAWLVNFNKLRSLILDSNKLSGNIPFAIKNLTQLQHLSLLSNRLEGSIPISIFELEDLQQLSLSFNNLSGTVDLSMFNLHLKSLEILELSSNNLSLLTGATVNINSQKFTTIGFSSCNLSNFPYFLHNQDQLLSLDLSSNKIAGQVPAWFLNVATNSLEYLNLSSNQLTSFGHKLNVLPWTGLDTLDLSFNKLQGQLPVPSGLMFSYIVSNNELTGHVPPRLCNANKLGALDLSYNNLSGMLPKCLGNFGQELSILKLKGNNFHGSIPQTFMNSSKLMMIDLSNNSFQGRIPQSLANCVQLKFLNLGNNQITDFFPSWLGTLPVLEVLVLKFNKLYGIIEDPKTELEFPKLRIIDLSHNRFTGNLPAKSFWCWNAMKDTNPSKLTYLHETFLPPSHPVGPLFGSFDYSLILSNKGIDMEYEKLSNLITAIILSSNEFVGEIPISIASLKGLRTLNLSNNNLKGHIPSSLGNLTVVESLDLSNNKFSGEIPQRLGELTALAVFDVSNNYLTGPIPGGTQFTTFNRSSFDGNPGLCGEPLLKKCEKSETPEEEEPQSKSPFAFSWKIVVIGYACGTIIGVVLGHIFSTRKQEWLVMTFRLPLKTTARRKRRRRN